MVASKNNSLILKFIRYWIPVIIYAALIFYLSSIPGEDIPFLFPFQDVITHIIEYAIFAILINRALKAYNPLMAYNRRFLWVFFASFLYALSDEFHQAFIPDRFASGSDLFTDAIGSFIGNLIYR